MNNKLILAAVASIAILVIAAGGFYFMNANKSATIPTANEVTTPTETPEAQAQTSPSVMAENEFTVEGGEFKFTPSEITVKKGEKVKITFKNTGKFQHDYVIANLNATTKRLQPGEQETVEFTPEKIGEFKIVCSVGNHEEQGMTGILVVE